VLGQPLTGSAARRRLRANDVPFLILARGIASGGGPSAMAEIGGRPLLWHIILSYSRCGFRRFVIGLSDGADDIGRFVADGSQDSDLDDGLSVDLISAGGSTATGGCIRRLADHLGPSTFILARSDALSDVDPRDLLAFHRSHGRLATMLAVRPPARFGRLALVGDTVVEFAEKPRQEDEWISGGLFVLERGAFDYLPADDTPLENEPLERLAQDGQLMACRHDSFWLRLDTPRDRLLLERLWGAGQAPWVVRGRGGAPEEKRSYE